MESPAAEEEQEADTQPAALASARTEEEELITEQTKTAAVTEFFDRLAGEPRLSGWSNRREAEIVGAFNPLSTAGLRLEQVDCRTSVCRLRVRGERLERALDELISRLSRPPFGDGAFAYTDAHGDLVAYVPREGTELPWPEPDELDSLSAAGLDAR